MNRVTCKTSSLKLLFPALLMSLLLPFNGLAALEMEELLPPGQCGTGWVSEGKATFYDRDTLSDRINGEAELYFPYGFDRMVAARFFSKKNFGDGMDLEVYRMGSLLDAYGMFANYRPKDGRSTAIGTESSLSGSQLFLYQGRYFIRIQTTGSDSTDPEALKACGAAVVQRIPESKNRPAEMAPLDRIEKIIKGSERYLPQSLLGYDFLNRGVMADAIIDRQNLQIFLLLGGTEQSASAAFERYRSQLSQVKIMPAADSASFLDGIDPLYGPVTLLRKGSCLTGAIKFSKKQGINALLEEICR